MINSKFVGAVIVDVNKPFSFVLINMVSFITVAQEKLTWVEVI
jgi:hypothetical protein